MAFGLPVYIAPYRVIRAIERGCLVAARLALIAAVLAPLAAEVANPGGLLWPASLALLPALAMLWLLGRWRSIATAVGFLVVGGAGLVWYTGLLSAQLPGAHGGSAIFAVPTIALALNAGRGRTIVSAIWWCLAGLLTAYAAVAIGVTISNAPFGLHPAPVFALGVFAVLILAIAGRWRTRALRSSLRRAVHNDRLAGLRVQLESEAAALMHDTVLGDLIALSRASPGVLSPQLATAIDRDLAQLLGEDWLLVRSNPGVQDRTDHWQSTALFGAIDEARQLGLDVVMSGDLVSVTELDRERERALALAVRQCLVNVHRHSTTLEVEVVVSAAPDGISVMVVDAGAGFDVTRTPDDRLGLRNSVVRRIEEMGGSAQIWSTLGVGTSVLLHVPFSSGSGSGGAGAGSTPGRQTSVEAES